MTGVGEELFERSNEYDRMLSGGLRLSGEDKRFFMEGRVRNLRGELPAGFAPRRILDFGCGTGETSRLLAEMFPESRVLGIDTASGALAYAEATHSSDRTSFRLLCDLSPKGDFDLCYSNGVFHHIHPRQRLETVELIHRTLAPGGYFALFENNPWNPGTRLAMRRIPFDRDAVPQSALETCRLLRAGGFAQSSPARYLFHLPRFLAFLRFSERWLARVPLGAQYYVLAKK